MIERRFSKLIAEQSASQLCQFRHGFAFTTNLLEAVFNSRTRDSNDKLSRQITSCSTAALINEIHENTSLQGRVGHFQMQLVKNNNAVSQAAYKTAAITQAAIFKRELRETFTCVCETHRYPFTTSDKYISVLQRQINQARQVVFACATMTVKPKRRNTTAGGVINIIKAHEFTLRLREPTEDKNKIEQ